MAHIVHLKTLNACKMETIIKARKKNSSEELNFVKLQNITLGTLKLNYDMGGYEQKLVDFQEMYKNPKIYVEHKLLQSSSVSGVIYP